MDLEFQNLLIICFSYVSWTFDRVYSQAHLDKLYSVDNKLEIGDVETQILRGSCPS